MYNQPPVGSTVMFATKHQSNLLGQEFDTFFYEDLKVLPSQKFDKPHTFRVSAIGEPHIKERVVSLGLVDVLVVDGEKFVDDGVVIETLTVKVDGSKGQVYDVTIVGDTPTECTCTGFKFRRNCRHLAEALTIVDL